jgi:hypothetical protein
MSASKEFVWSLRRLVSVQLLVGILGEAGSSIESSHRSWHNIPAIHGVDLEDLRSVEMELLRTGLLEESVGRHIPSRKLVDACGPTGRAGVEAILAVVLTASRPLWLQTAAGNLDELAEELIPDDIGAGIAGVITDPQRREAFLLQRASVFEAEVLNAIGALGEEYVMLCCIQELKDAGRERLSQSVRRVSLVSDELGYDVVAPRIDESSRRLEVKSTRNLGDEIAVYLSRNEFFTGLADPDWALVVVRVAESGCTIGGWIHAADLEPLVPIDQNARGQWRSVRIKLRLSQLKPGIPPSVTSKR